MDGLSFYKYGLYVNHSLNTGSLITAKYKLRKIRELCKILKIPGCQKKLLTTCTCTCNKCSGKTRKKNYSNPINYYLGYDQTR